MVYRIETSWNDRAGGELIFETTDLQEAKKEFNRHLSRYIGQSEYTYELMEMGKDYDPDDDYSPFDYEVLDSAVMRGAVESVEVIDNLLFELEQKAFDVGAVIDEMDYEDFKKERMTICLRDVFFKIDEIRDELKGV